ncbi:DUF2243 domain-containing protein [Peribacillus glennii]|uniref:DUF2243 domain-containing protein n=1 Tax=Peribacillus glennii TaxID=2303991 RepID=A0A372LAD5_9BACI|nr:DUF2243 domain-containing protein [Peribacillus glennii]RFU62179.1 DUF2243 domain-containing protein [Peribacillus glennii]
MKNNRLFWGAFLFGVGMIGMLDGIVLHQLLQWHSVYMPTDRHHQIMSDGFFHLFVTIIIFFAGILLWQSNPAENRHNTRKFWGAFLLGAGMFNFLEGIIDHHLLGIHHVKPGPNQFLYDVLFDISGLLLILAGWLLHRAKKRSSSMETRNALNKN